MKFLTACTLALFFFGTVTTASPIHPTIEWKDALGSPTKDMVSYEASCGQCHDIDYIKSHDSHAKLYANGNFNCLTCHSTSVPQTAPSQVTTVTRPRTEHCQQCHTNDNTSSKKSGRFYSGKKVSESKINLPGKSHINHAWDIHAERGLNCNDCHFSTNNPVFLRKEDISKPSHLEFDPRRPDIGEFLKRPSHKLAFTSGERYDCTYCHTSEHSGIWKDRSDIHFKKLECQSCHTPTINSPLLHTINNTIQSNNVSVKTFKNVDTKGLITPFRPTLFKTDIQSAYKPYNNITEYYFYATTQKKRVPDSVITQITQRHNAEIQTYLDLNRDGNVTSDEQGPASGIYFDFMKMQLLEQGFSGIVVKKNYSFHPIAHNTVPGEYATKKCSECHSSQNAFSTTLASQKPTETLSSLSCNEDNLYIFGKECGNTVNLIGIASIVLVLLGILLHGGLRCIIHLKHGGHHEMKTKKVYIYRLYERIWHWTQAFVILILITTGLVIHTPEVFTFLPFEAAITIHRILGIILGVNAIFSLFYHISTGKIAQYIPEPKGFFAKAFTQQMYYLKGIFKKEKHPFEKLPERRLNPLQQIAYLGLLNVLLPALMITGFIIYFYPYDNVALEAIGGLETIATIHTLCSWLIISFLMMHIYLTTTGHTVTEYTKAMITGWEDVEDRNSTDAHPQSKETHDVSET
ncbi:MAG: cytochrome b/b6 domain-containing protein [Fibrobacterales bacterium]